MNIRKILRTISALPLIRKDWYSLYTKAHVCGSNSRYDYALRMKMRLTGNYVGSTAVISSQPAFPHGMNGIFISGGGYNG